MTAWLVPLPFAADLYTRFAFSTKRPLVPLFRSHPGAQITYLGGKLPGEAPTEGAAQRNVRVTWDRPFRWGWARPLGEAQGAHCGAGRIMQRFFATRPRAVRGGPYSRHHGRELRSEPGNATNEDRSRVLVFLADPQRASAGRIRRLPDLLGGGGGAASALRRERPPRPSTGLGDFFQLLRGATASPRTAAVLRWTSGPRTKPIVGCRWESRSQGIRVGSVKIGRPHERTTGAGRGPPLPISGREGSQNVMAGLLGKDEAADWAATKFKDGWFHQGRFFGRSTEGRAKPLHSSGRSERDQSVDTNGKTVYPDRWSRLC